jgi:hypothetical protein
VGGPAEIVTGVEGSAALAEGEDAPRLVAPLALRALEMGEHGQAIDLGAAKPVGFPNASPRGVGRAS